MSEENLATLMRGYEAFSQGDKSVLVELAGEIATPDVEWGATGAFPGVEGMYRGPEAMQEAEQDGGLRDPALQALRGSGPPTLSRQAARGAARVAITRKGRVGSARVPRLNRKEADMRSAFTVLVITGALALMPAVAQADFPEQPGDHMATGCANIGNKGTARAFGPGLNVTDGLVPAATEVRISQIMYVDACLEPTQ